MEIRFYNEMPSQIQNLKNTKLFRRKLKFVFIATDLPRERNICLMKF